MTNHRLESDSEILKAWLNRHEVYYLDARGINSRETVARPDCSVVPFTNVRRLIGLPPNSEETQSCGRKNHWVAIQGQTSSAILANETHPKSFYTILARRREIVEAYSAEWSNIKSGNDKVARKPAGYLITTLRITTKALLVLIPALAIVIGAIWTLTVPGLIMYLQATIWASGFAFLGAAVDLQKPLNGLCLATGLTLPILAILSSWVAVEFLVVAAAIMAACLTTIIWRLID